MQHRLGDTKRPFTAISDTESEASTVDDPLALLESTRYPQTSKIGNFSEIIQLIKHPGLPVVSG